MSTATTPFYVTGGTLPPGAPSYVERRADRELFAALQRGEFCYVLTSRQMGKSSLMAHTTACLRDEGIAVVNLDLTRLGQNLTVEQWYDGLLGHLGRQLALEDELEEYWQARERLAPLQRWLGALQTVVLPRVPGRLVVAIDEIDAVRSLPFSTDEFFAAIRDCSNRRSQDPEFQRLTFCLLGVATPSDLIQDTRTTPFNIGKRIELTDFTPAEAAPLVRGLGREAPLAAALLQRVLLWTGGHPYLTQRLCQAAADDPGVVDPEGVDRHCERLFLSSSAREKDDNLLFVRERLLRSEADRAALLYLYGQVLSDRRVPVDDTNQLVSILRLSGIVRASGGFLQVRNRIYQRVFDRNWITSHMPDAELRRQRSAYWRGLLRAAGVAGVILAMMAGLVLASVRQAEIARRATTREARQRRLAERRLYNADMLLAQQAWEAEDVRRALELLKEHQPGPGQDDLRGFEWHYLQRLCQGNQQFTLRGSAEGVGGSAVAPDSRTLAWGSANGVVKLWDMVAKRVVATFSGHKAAVTSVAFSPDGRTLVSGSEDGRVILCDVERRRAVATLQGHKGGVRAVALSLDGTMLASGGRDQSIRIWDLPSARQLASLDAQREVACVAFSPDGGTVASGCDYDTTVRLWDLASRRVIASLRGHKGWIWSVAFTPDGKTLAAGTVDNAIWLWDLASQRVKAKLRGHRSPVVSLAISPDGKTLVSGSDDSTIRLWSIPTGQQVSSLIGHTNMVTAGGDGAVRLWRAPPSLK